MCKCTLPAKGQKERFVASVMSESLSQEINVGNTFGSHPLCKSLGNMEKSLSSNKTTYNTGAIWLTSRGVTVWLQEDLRQCSGFPCIQRLSPTKAIPLPQTDLLPYKMPSTINGRVFYACCSIAAVLSSGSLKDWTLQISLDPIVCSCSNQLRRFLKNWIICLWKDWFSLNILATSTSSVKEGHQ